MEVTPGSRKEKQHLVAQLKVRQPCEIGASETASGTMIFMKADATYM